MSEVRRGSRTEHGLPVTGTDLHGQERRRKDGHRCKEGYHTQAAAEVLTERGRATWVECRECEHRMTVAMRTRREMIEVLDAGTVRCPRCGGRMVEG